MLLTSRFTSVKRTVQHWDYTRILWALPFFRWRKDIVSLFAKLMFFSWTCMIFNNMSTLIDADGEDAYHMRLELTLLEASAQ